MPHPQYYCDHCDIFITYEDDHESDCPEKYALLDHPSIEQLTFADYFDKIADDMELFQGNFTTSYDIQNGKRLEKLKKQWD